MSNNLELMMSAPSFSSFPSFFDTSGGLSEPSQSSSQPASEDRKRKEGNDQGGRGKSDGFKKKRKRDRTKEDDFDKSRALADKWQSDFHDTESDRPLFYSDRKGDPLNIRYGTMNTGEVPKYYLVDRGRKILGLSEALGVVHRTNVGIEISAGNGRKVPSLVDSKALAILVAPPKRTLLSSGDHYKYEEVDGFLPLPSRRSRDNDQAYLSIAGSNDHPNSSDAGSSDDDYTTPLTSHQLTMRSLEQHLSTAPSSVSAWLSLLSLSLSTIPTSSKNAIKARAEVSLSILNRALSAHPANATSVTLWLKYLKSGEEVWHESKLRAEWENALNVGSVDIWMEWLEWRIRKGGKGIDNVAKDARRVFDALGDREEDEIGKVRMFWRVGVAFQLAGFVERASAMFQAQAELMFEVPQTMYGQPLTIQLDALEEFWDSEVPRLGEADAKGWAAWVASGRPDHTPDTSLSTTVRPPSDCEMLSDPYCQWAKEELFADSTLYLSTRTTDEPNEDPYATVLFSDIRPILLSLRTMEAKNVFRFAWLSLLGLHIPGFCDSIASEGGDDRWSFIHLTMPSYLSSIFTNDTRRLITVDAYAGVLVGRQKEYVAGFGPVKNWALGVLGPLDSVEGKAAWWGKDDVLPCAPFVSRLFAQLRIGADNCEWDVLALAFAAAMSIKGALKLSRSFLSTARDSLPHWAAHARLERLRGRPGDARKVYQTILASHSPTVSSTISWDWAEMEWLEAKADIAALQVVLRSAGVEGSDSVTFLRAKRNLEEAAQYAEGWKNQEAWVKLRGLLELLTGSPGAMLSVFDDHLLHKELRPGSVTHESLTVAALLMLYRHSSILRNPSPPALLRARLERALVLYPSNSIILGMFLQGERGQGVWGRIRGILGESTMDGIGKDKDVARRVVEVWIAGWEKGRWEAEVERTRSGLASAVQNERTRGSAVLWRIYIEFEIRVGELLRAKNLLFRAIGDCPLTKGLYLLAFGPLRSVFAPHELNTFADAMAERQIRTRRALEEITEGWEEVVETIEGSEGDSEVEENARELRRLRPF